MNYRLIRKCPLCRSEAFNDLYRLTYPIFKCRNCGLVFVRRQPDIRNEKFYDEGYYQGRSSCKTNLCNENVLDTKRIETRIDNCRGVVDMVLQKAFQPSGKWLDIGCGPGFLLSTVKERGWQVFGIEPSPFAAAYAKERFQISDVKNCSVETSDFPKDYFDVISMQHVIEHFSDPLASMKRIAIWLKKGGLLYLETPDIASPIAKNERAGWEHIKLPEHLFYFTPKTLTMIMNKIGCRIIAIRHPVQGTGLMNAACGGERKSRIFYERFRKYEIFRHTVRIVRYLNELYRHHLKKEGDIIQLLAVKKWYR